MFASGAVIAFHILYQQLRGAYLLRLTTANIYTIILSALQVTSTEYSSRALTA